MKQSFTAIRAIATTFARRIYIPVVISVALIALFFLVLVIWLLTISAWWWFLAIPIFSLVIVATTVLIIAGVLIKVIGPKTTKAQRTEIGMFIDHVQELAEITATPKFILLFRVIKDALSPQKTAYIESVISGVGSLRSEYQSILRSFSS